MIQAVNATNANSYKRQNVNFGKNSTEQVSYASQDSRKPSKAKAIAAYATAQFFAGAIISSVLNLGSNLVQKLKKVPDPAKIIPLKTIAKEAAIMGGIFIAMGLIVDGVFSLFNRKKS